MGDLDAEQTAPEQIEPGAANAPEGAVTEPTTDEVASLYKDLGIKATVPSGKPKGRPKTTDVRAKDGAKNPAGNSDAGDEEDNDDEGQPKNAPNSSKNGGTGNGADAKGAKVGKDSAKVSDESEEADAGVRDAKSAGKKDSERGSEEDAIDGDDGTGQESDESEDETEKGKRPGKSNPAIERRIQQINEAKVAAERRAEEAEKKLEEATRAQQQSRVQQEDPEYTIEDFSRVMDNSTGEVVDLSPEQAELAWRRWKDGYEARSEQRNAEVNRQKAREEHQSEVERQVMQRSVEAYDTLASLMDEYPELVSGSGKFDEDFAADALPIIQESIEYLEGTEPGNPDENLPVIVGLKIHPERILKALKGVSQRKRSLPLNGVNDSVESRSSVSVPHSRSSDPTVHAANELYKELGIDKRI